jgi:hypothetical protein
MIPAPDLTHFFVTAVFSFLVGLESGLGGRGAGGRDDSLGTLAPEQLK